MKPAKCRKCHGRMTVGGGRNKKPCPECGGLGEAPPDPCPNCGIEAICADGVCGNCGVGIPKQAIEYNKRKWPARRSDGRRAMGDFEDGITTQIRTKADKA